MFFLCGVVGVVFPGWDCILCRAHMCVFFLCAADEVFCLCRVCSINFRGSTPNVVVTSATPSSVQQAPSPGPKHSDGVEASSPLGSPHEPAAGIRQVEASASLSGQNSPADEDSFSEVSSIVGGSGQRPVQVPSLDMATALAGNRTCVVPEHRDLGDGGRPLVICKPKNAPVVGAD